MGPYAGRSLRTPVLGLQYDYLCCGNGVGRGGLSSLVRKCSTNCCVLSDSQQDLGAKCVFGRSSVILFAEFKMFETLEMSI